MPVCVAQIVQKGPSGTPPLATMAIVLASLATSHRWLLSFLPRAPGKAPGRHVGGFVVAWVQSDNLPRQAPCRGRCLVASGSLSLTGSCRDAWCVAASSSKCLGWPSRQAPLAGALSPWLEYFVLEWLQGEPRRTLAVARQALLRGAATARAQVRDTRVPLL